MQPHRHRIKEAGGGGGVRGAVAPRFLVQLEFEVKVKPICTCMGHYCRPHNPNHLPTPVNHITDMYQEGSVLSIGTATHLVKR